MVETQEFTNTYKTMDNNGHRITDQEPMPVSNHKCRYYLYVIIDTIASIAAIVIYYIRVQNPDPDSLLIMMPIWGMYNLVINIIRIYCTCGIARHRLGYPRNNQLMVIAISLCFSILLLYMFTIALSLNINNIELKQDLFLSITWYSIYGYNIIVAFITARILIYYCCCCRSNEHGYHQII